MARRNLAVRQGQTAEGARANFTRAINAAHAQAVSLGE